MNKVSLAILFTIFVWSSIAVPLKPDESTTESKSDQPNPPEPGHDGKLSVPKPGELHPLPPPVPERRPVRDVATQEPTHIHLPQLQTKENTDKPQETTTEKRNKRSSEDSDSDEDERRIENLKDDKPEAKKRPARDTHEEHHQNPPATNQGGTTEKSRKAREVSTTTQKVPSLLLHSTTENVRKVRDVQPPKPIGITPLPAKIDDNTQRKDSSLTTAKP